MQICATIIIGTIALPNLATAQTRPEPPSFQNARYGEDYSYLRDPENRSGAWWEPFKFIPIDPAGTSYLTVGADMRVRHEMYVNNLWGDAPVPNDAYSLFRVMPYADLHLGPNVRLFGQLIGSWSAGVEPAASPVDETGFDLLQAFGHPNGSASSERQRHAKDDPQLPAELPATGTE